ncbi:hypothetical protein [Luteolibacter arcticus]|uniref:hypothetical protein n=1 Tax=Luteolibacter arcticus TaxID=1581411 RepID=UPI002222CF82|nr:hypothetical protein [Luteolibacter arcticus]
MSNVPAYPKNPALHHETATHPEVDPEGSGQATANETKPVEIKDLDLSPPGSSFRNLVELGPVRVVLIAAGVGFIAGRFARY